MGSMSYLQKQNKGASAGRYRTKELPAILPEVQTGNTCKCQEI